MGHFYLQSSKLIALISSIVLTEAMEWNEEDRPTNWNSGDQSGGWNNRDAPKGPIGGWDDDRGNSFSKGHSFPGRDQSRPKGEGRLEDSIPGTPGQSYPHYSVIPRTSFDCKRFNNPGYYGDIEARCQVFHICEIDGRQHSFLCPVGTTFNQKTFVCDWWYNVNCEDSPFHYDLNRNLYNEGPKTNQETGRNKGSGTVRSWNSMGSNIGNNIGSNKGSGIVGNIGSNIGNNIGSDIVSNIGSNKGISRMNSPNWSNPGNQKGRGNMGQGVNQWNRNPQNFQDDWNQMGENINMQYQKEMGNWNANNQKMNPNIHQDMQKGMNARLSTMDKGSGLNLHMQVDGQSGSANQWRGDHGGPQQINKFPPSQGKSDNRRIKRRRKVRKPMKSNQLSGQVNTRISKSSWSSEKRFSNPPNSNQVNDYKDKSWNKQEHGYKEDIHNLQPNTNAPGFASWEGQGGHSGHREEWKNQPQMKDQNWNKNDNQQIPEFQRNHGIRVNLVPLNFIDLLQNDFKGDYEGDHQDTGDLAWNDNSPKGHNNNPNWK